MEMDGQACFLTQGLDQRIDRRWAAQAGHVLDANNVGASALQFACLVHVILELVLGTAGIKQITGVAHGAFAQAATFDYRIHGGTHIVDPVQ